MFLVSSTCKLKLELFMCCETCLNSWGAIFQKIRKYRLKKYWSN